VDIKTKFQILKNHNYLFFNVIVNIFS